jgi:MoxR-like ATPase
MAAKANAFMDGRDYVIPDDIKEICKDVLRHRIGLTYEAQADRVTSEDIIDELLQKKVKTP